MQKKILIVEDDPVLLKVLSTKVKDADYTVVEAKDGKQALAKFKKWHPDLVLLDIVMPLKSGFEVLEEIKIKQKSKTPVIILSNLAEDQNIDKWKKLGASDYITKSNFTLEEIIIKINKIIGSNGQ
jgi:two-component system response regulator VicR